MEGAGKLRDLVAREGGAFQRVDNRWRPQNLFFELQMQELLADMTRRSVDLAQAVDELKGLDRAEACLKLLRQIRFVVRRAAFVRRANHLAFASAVAEFYEAYGEVLRLLRIEQLHGNIDPNPTP